jgi:hypothetical protein
MQASWFWQIPRVFVQAWAEDKMKEGQAQCRISRGGPPEPPIGFWCDSESTGAENKSGNMDRGFHYTCRFF